MKMNKYQIFAIVAGVCSIASFTLAISQFFSEPMYIQVYTPQMSAITGEFQNVLTTVNVSHLSIFIGTVLAFGTIMFILYKKKKIFR